MKTGNRIIVAAYANDRVWGIGRSQTNPAACMETWKGTNLLGQVKLETFLVFMVTAVFSTLNPILHQRYLRNNVTDPITPLIIKFQGIDGCS